MTARRKVFWVVVAAFGFGLAAAAVKGAGGPGGVAEVRSALGNLSTPWLLVPFVAGTAFSRLRSGALVGVLASMVALIGFYLVNSLMHDLGHGFVGDLRLELSANRGYLQGGLIAGPLFGALGAWWHQRQTLRATVVAGVLLMAEPVILVLLGALGPGGVLPSGDGTPMVVRIVPGWGLSADSSTVSMAVYAGEFVLGLAVVLFAALRRPGLLRA